jgi:hypothetical protein
MIRANKILFVIFFFFTNVNAIAGELSYICEVTHIYKLSSNGSLGFSPFEKQMKGSTFSVSRVTGQIIGEVIPTLMAKSTKVVNPGSTKNSFKAVADFGNQFQIIEIKEFLKGTVKPFVSSSMGGAGIVTGLCK